MSLYALVLEGKSDVISDAERPGVRCRHAFIERPFVDLPVETGFNEQNELYCSKFVGAISGQPLRAYRAREQIGPCGPTGTRFVEVDTAITDRIGWESVAGTDNARAFVDWVRGIANEQENFQPCP